VAALVRTSVSPWNGTLIHYEEHRSGEQLHKGRTTKSIEGIDVKLIQKALLAGFVASASLLTGCASVNMAPAALDAELKTFAAPPADMSAVYIYRDSTIGAALKKDVRIDGRTIGETGYMTYFYQQLPPGEHILATESEFGDNSIVLDAKAGQNHFVQQYIRFGAFVAGAGLRVVPENEGKRGVQSTKLAQSAE
jgi:hypothetical protein|tara:strand:- start:104 stop:685 length:582 start_codon:yes stop_codon:yes gene_type:complete